MEKSVRVLVLGTGNMGAGIARLVLEKKGLKLVGAFARRRDRGGADMGQMIGLNRDLGTAVHSDIERAVLDTRPDVAIQATCSRLDDAWREIEILLRHGVATVSIAEEMAFPACRCPAIAEEMHHLAVSRQAAVVGTGINPGFIFDLLVIALTGACAHVESVTVTRVNDLSPYGPSVLRAQGVGLGPTAFEDGLKEGTVAGHVGFPESIHMIAKVLGVVIDRVDEDRKPVISRIRRETPHVTVEPGQAAGCLHTAVAYRAGKPFITFVHPQQILPHLEGVETGDTIEIVGKPNLKFVSRPEISGGEGTIALAVNMIPRILNAPPGLHTMADLPVPAACLGDVRDRLDAR